MIWLAQFLAGAKLWPWKLIGKVVLAAAVCGVIWWVGKQIYAAGYREADQSWKDRIQHAQNQTHTAESHLNQDVARRSEQSHTRTVERLQVVESARNEIANAADTQARYAAYLAARSSLRNAASAHLDRATADYLSTVPA